MIFLSAAPYFWLLYLPISKSNIEEDETIIYRTKTGLKPFFLQLEKKFKQYGFQGSSGQPYLRVGKRNGICFGSSSKVLYIDPKGK